MEMEVITKWCYKSYFNCREQSLNGNELKRIFNCDISYYNCREQTWIWVQLTKSRWVLISPGGGV